MPWLCESAEAELLSELELDEALFCCDKKAKLAAFSLCGDIPDVPNDGEGHGVQDELKSHWSNNLSSSSGVGPPLR